MAANEEVGEDWFSDFMGAFYDGTKN